MEIDGAMVVDRQAWAVEAHRVARESYSDPANGKEHLLARLRARVSAGRLAMESGNIPNLLTLFDLFTAKAKLKQGKAHGEDGVSNNMLRRLPFLFWIGLLKLLHNRIIANEPACSHFWTFISYWAIPKSGINKGFGTWRLIALMCALQKIYLATFIKFRKDILCTHTAHLYGFMPGRCTGDIVDNLRLILQKFHAWAIPAIIGGGDIRIAFPAMKRRDMLEALIDKGLHPIIAKAFMQEMFDLKAIVRMQGSPDTDSFPVVRGAREGGPGTVYIFNAVLDLALRPALLEWQRKSYGLGLGGQFLSHAIWADNIIFLAKDRHEFEAMASSLTIAIHGRSFSWKPDSLFAMPTRAASGMELCYVLDPDLEVVEFTILEEIELFGVMLRFDGHCLPSLMHRMMRADRLFYSKFHILGDVHFNLRRRVEGFYIHIAGCFLHGSSGWTASADICNRIRAWELAKLRTMVRGKRIPGETYIQYLRRKNYYIIAKLKRWQVKSLTKRFLEIVFAMAMRFRNFVPMMDGFSLGTAALNWRTGLDWEIQAAVGVHEDPYQIHTHWKHPRRGRFRTDWGTIWILCYGLGWQAVFADGSSNFRVKREAFLRKCVHVIKGVKVLQREVTRVAGCKILLSNDNLEAANDPNSMVDWQPSHIKVPRCEIVGDSKDVIGWCNGEIEAKDVHVRAEVRATLTIMNDMLRSGIAVLRDPSSEPFRHVRRRWNKGADAEANRFMDVSAQ